MVAYRDLVRTDGPAALRPWLYAIARHRCLNLLRDRRERPLADVPEVASDHLSSQVATRHDLRVLLADLAGLPDDQRHALVLAELGDASHEEIARALGCRQTKVKALVFQARSSLSAARAARETPCSRIREQLLTLRGGARLRATLRRHLTECPGCQAFAEDVRRERRQRLLLPLAPIAGFKRTVLGALLGSGGGTGGAFVSTGILGAGRLAATALATIAIPAGGIVVLSDVARPASPAAEQPPLAPALMAGADPAHARADGAQAARSDPAAATGESDQARSPGKRDEPQAPAQAEETGASAEAAPADAEQPTASSKAKDATPDVASVGVTDPRRLAAKSQPPNAPTVADPGAPAATTPRPPDPTNAEPAIRTASPPRPTHPTNAEPATPTTTNPPSATHSANAERTTSAERAGHTGIRPEAGPATAADEAGRPPVGAGTERVKSSPPATPATGGRSEPAEATTAARATRPDARAERRRPPTSDAAPAPPSQPPTADQPPQPATPPSSGTAEPAKGSQPPTADRQKPAQQNAAPAAPSQPRRR